MERVRRPRAAITFVEALIVVSVAVLLFEVYTITSSGRGNDARITATRDQIKQFTKALRLFRQDTGFYPTTEEGLKALISKPERATNWKEEGYLGQEYLPNDPWGHPYEYVSPGKRSRDFDIISYGADGKVGGQGYNADLTNKDFE